MALERWFGQLNTSSLSIKQEAASGKTGAAYLLHGIFEMITFVVLF